ncbi:MAG: PAS domain-containing protein [Gammaproteobacteria bacterium]
MNDAARHSPPGVLAVVLAYAFFGMLWILLSDRAMGLLISDPATLVRASMFKGWFYVAVTSLLLYALVRWFARALVAAHQRELALERERRRPPTMLTSIADASEDAIFAKDEQGRYLLFNHAAVRFTGMPADEVLGNDDRVLFPPEQAAQVMATDRRVRETGQAETNEEMLQTVAGERVFFATKGPLRGTDGRIFGTYGISRDITERKRGDEALRLLADDMQSTLQAIPDLLFEIDAEGRYLSVKASNEALLAAPPDSLIGRTVGEVLPPADAATMMDALAAASRTGTDYGRTITLPLAAGTRCFELSIARKPALQGHVDRFVVLSRDITYRMSAEAELRRRNEELERFNRAATDRELRMVGLKREVNELARAAGQPARYDTSFADVPGAQAAP